MQRHHRRSTLVFAAVLAFVGALTVGRPLLPTAAQEATPDARVGHPVVGAWLVNKDPGDPIATSYEIFHADGTYAEVTVGVGTGVGVWRAVGERTVEVIGVYQDTNPDPTVFELGTITGRQSRELDAAGNTMTGTYTVEVQTPDGTVVFDAGPLTEAGPLTLRATRVVHAPVVPIGTPAAATPTA